MDRLTTFELFVRIVDRGSFSAAAADMGVSRPVATAAIQALEQRLGARLLHRTTRLVRPSAEGETYYQRCLAILADIEDADAQVNGAVRGTVRVDMVGRLARTLLMPALPAFLHHIPNSPSISGKENDLSIWCEKGSIAVVRAGPCPTVR
jgi:DNA-binding transcriptional LysR family regulator